MSLRQEQPRAHDLAARSLQAAMREDWKAVSAAMQALNDETGGEGVRYALIAFCDWTIAAQNRARGLADFEAPGVARPVWLNTETGHLDLNADDVPSPARWAGQLVAARAAMDQGTFNALLAAMPDDGLERGRYAAALIEGCAASMSLLQGGAA